MGKLTALFRRHADTLEAEAEKYEARQCARGYEGSKQIMDGTPMAPPVGYVKQPSMVEHVRNMVRSELLKRATDESGLDTFDEADDFDVDDNDGLPYSGFERDFEPVAPEVDKAVPEVPVDVPAARKPPEPAES